MKIPVLLFLGGQAARGSYTKTPEPRSLKFKAEARNLKPKA